MEWGKRAALAIVIAALGYVAVITSFATTLRAQQPERAHALALGDGRIAAELAERLSGPDASMEERIRSDGFARAALRRDPTAVSAAATLGLNAQIRGETTAARRWFGFSQHLSRRDLRTQLWAIEDAVAGGDVTGALRHYDIALRTSRSAGGLLFPVLGAAIADPAVRVALAQTLARAPDWSPFFIADVTAAGADPKATALLFEDLAEKGIKISERAQALVTARLVEAGAIDAAWRYYASIRPGATRGRSRDPRFALSLVEPTPFDWQPVNDAGITVSIQSGDNGDLVDFAAPASVGGVLLRQLQLLPPGDYVVEGHSIGIDQPSASLPYWKLACIEGRELGRMAVPRSSEAKGEFSGRITVPADCPVQYLSLNAQPSDAIDGTTGQIDRVLLRPVQRMGR